MGLGVTPLPLFEKVVNLTYVMWAASFFSKKIWFASNILGGKSRSMIVGRSVLFEISRLFDFEIETIDICTWVKNPGVGYYLLFSKKSGKEVLNIIKNAFYCIVINKFVKKISVGGKVLYPMSLITFVFNSLKPWDRQQQK